MYDMLMSAEYFNHINYDENEGCEEMKLYELSQQYNQLWDMVNSEEIDLQMLEDTLQGIEGEIEDKVENIIKLMKSIESDEQAIKTEEERLYNRRKALENRRESIKKWLECSLMSAGIDKVKTAIFTATIQNNPPSVVIPDEAIFKAVCPDKYLVVQQPKIDKKAIMEDLKNGVEVRGATLQQTRGLRIR